MDTRGLEAWGVGDRRVGERVRRLPLTNDNQVQGPHLGWIKPRMFVRGFEGGLVTRGQLALSRRAGTVSKKTKVETSVPENQTRKYRNVDQVLDVTKYKRFNISSWSGV